MSVKSNIGVVTDGLVFYVDAGNDLSYSGSGGTWSDLVGGNDGSFSNMDDINNPSNNYDSANGGSITFDGVDDYIDLGSINSSNPLSLYNITDFSISFWMYVDSTGVDSYQRIIDKSDGGNGQNGYGVYVGDVFPAKRLGLVIGGSAALDTGIDSNVYAFDEWTYVTYTKQSSNYELYVNASSYFTSTSSNIVASTTTNCRIGSWNHSTTREFKGKISNLMIHHKTLSSAEILQNYNALKNRFI